MAAQSGDVTDPESSASHRASWGKVWISTCLSDSQDPFQSTLTSQSPPRFHPEFPGISLQRALLASLSETEGWDGDQGWEND